MQLCLLILCLFAEASDDDRNSDLYCVACNKLFKTPKA